MDERAAIASAPPEWDWAEAFTYCLRICRQILGDTAEAEDAAQEAVIRAWRNRGRCLAPEAPHAWWAAIARREALRRRLQAAPHRETLLPDADLDFAVRPDIDGVVERIDLEQAVGRLTLEDRSLLVLRYGADLTQPAVAAALDLPEGTVKVKLHRLRRRLRVALGIDYGLRSRR